MERVSLNEVKANFGDVLKLVGNGKQRIVIQDKGTDRAAVIPLEDLALLENLDGDRNIAVEHVPASEVKRHLSEDIDLVARRSERIVIQEKGQDVAALVPERDLAILEGLDDRLDIEAAKRALQKKLRDDRER